jgi:hypothetical protein
MKPMTRRTTIAASLLLGVGMAAWAQSVLAVKLGGRTLAGDAIRVRSKVYVSAEALRSAGIEVSLSGSTVILAPRAEARRASPAEADEAVTPVRPYKKRPAEAEGGANEQAAVEGRGNEWLFNGIFRFRVLSVERHSENERHGWKVKMEFRNGTKYNNYAPGGIGYEGMQLVLEDGESVNFSEFAEPQGDFMTPGLAQGAKRTGVAIFYTNLTEMPTRLILRVNPEGDDNIPPKFTVPDPSFRVDIRNLVSGR